MRVRNQTRTVRLGTRITPKAAEWLRALQVEAAVLLGDFPSRNLMAAELLESLSDRGLTDEQFDNLRASLAFRDNTKSTTTTKETK